MSSKRAAPAVKQERIDLTEAADDDAPARVPPSTPAARAARVAAAAAAAGVSVHQLVQVNRPCSKCDELLRSEPVLWPMWLAAVQETSQSAPLSSAQVDALQREFEVATFMHVEDIHRCMQVFAKENVVTVEQRVSGRHSYFINLTGFHACWNRWNRSDSRLLHEPLFAASMLTALRLHYNLDRNRHDDLQHIHIDWKHTAEPNADLMLTMTARVMAAADQRGRTITAQQLTTEIEQLPCVEFQRNCGLAILKRYSRLHRTHPDREALEKKANVELWSKLKECVSAIHQLLVQRVQEDWFARDFSPHYRQVMLQQMVAVHNPPVEIEVDRRAQWNEIIKRAQKAAPAQPPGSAVAEGVGSAAMPPPSFIPRIMQRRQHQQPAAQQPSPAALQPSLAAAAATAASPRAAASAALSALPSPGRAAIKTAPSAATLRESFKSPVASSRRVHFADEPAPAAAGQPIQPSPVAQPSGLLTPITPIALERLRLSRDGPRVLADRQRRRLGASSDDMMDASPRDQPTPEEHRQALALQRELKEAECDEKDDASSASVIKTEEAQVGVAADEDASEPADEEELPSPEAAMSMAEATDEPETDDEQDEASDDASDDANDDANDDAHDADNEPSDSPNAEAAASVSAASVLSAPAPPAVDAPMQECEDESAVPNFPSLDSGVSPPLSQMTAETADPVATASVGAAAAASNPSPSSVALAPSPLPMRKNVVLRQMQSSPLRVQPTLPSVSSSGPLPSRPAQHRVTANPVRAEAELAAANARCAPGSRDAAAAAAASASAHSSLTQSSVGWAAHKASAAAASAAAPAAAASSSVSSAAQIMAKVARDLAEIDDEHESAVSRTSWPDDPLQECPAMLRRWHEMLHDLDRWFYYHPPLQCVDALPSFRGRCFLQFQAFVAEWQVRPPASMAHWIHSVQQLDWLLQLIRQNSLVASLSSAGDTTQERVELADFLKQLHIDTDDWRQRCAIAIIDMTAVALAQPQPMEMEWRDQPSGLHIEEVATSTEDEIEPQ